ncbi:MAG TPA: hypothetical protein VJG66_00450 [Patescibacteria group bacterium]|nr:hypothetical protein [Patescibacteria group bacterium]
MLKKIVWFLKNDIVFWVFFTVLCLVVGLYILKKEDIKITVTFSQPYNNRVVTITGD